MKNEGLLSINASISPLIVGCMPLLASVPPSFGTSRRVPRVVAFCGWISGIEGPAQISVLFDMAVAFSTSNLSRDVSRTGECAISFSSFAILLSISRICSSARRFLFKVGGIAGRIDLFRQFGGGCRLHSGTEGILLGIVCTFP